MRPCIQFKTLNKLRMKKNKVTFTIKTFLSFDNESGLIFTIFSILGLRIALLAFMVEIGFSNLVFLILPSMVNIAIHAKSLVVFLFTGSVSNGV